MHKKLISALLIFCMIITMLMPMGAKPAQVSASTSFAIRTSMPTLTDENAKFYYSDINRFWKAGRLAPDFKYYKGIMDDGKTGGYVWGNCTWWAYSRASEVIGEPLDPNLRGNAGEWWSCNKKGKIYPYGKTPKAGSIVVYDSHVAFVEKVVEGKIYVSESGWQTKTYGPKSTDDFFFHYGTPWKSNGTPKGYIYVTEKKAEEIDKVAADYSVKITYNNLRMRSGPGTGYAFMGYIAKGTHQLQAVTTDGKWGQLASNGYWISMDYASKVEQISADNNLSSLAVGGYSLSPAFNGQTLSYTVSVPANVSSVVVSANRSDAKAAITGTGTYTLNTGANTASITVTAQNGSAKTYTVTINRFASKQVTVSVSDLNMRSGPGTKYKSKGKIKKGTYTIIQTSGKWGQLEHNGYWISMDYVQEAADSSTVTQTPAPPVTTAPAETTSSYKVKVKVTDLNMRSGPSTKYKSKGKIKKGTYVIAKTKNGWGKLEHNGYWIKLSYTQKASADAAVTAGYKVKVKVTELNMRTGPGTDYKSKGKIKKGTYTIAKTKNGWGKLKKNGYWIKLSYTKKVA